MSLKYNISFKTDAIPYSLKTSTKPIEKFVNQSYEISLKQVLRTCFIFSNALYNVGDYYTS